MASGLTEYREDPDRVLLLQRSGAVPISIKLPASKKMESFPLSDSVQTSVPFDVVVFSCENKVKKITTNVHVHVHTMMDNLNVFNLSGSTYEVPSRLLCPHPLLPKGTRILVHHMHEGGKRAVKLLRVATVAEVVAVKTNVSPIPLYFKAELLPFGLPKDNLRWHASEEQSPVFINPFNFSVPVDHLIPFLHPGNLIILKLVAECVHVACIVKRTDSPFAFHVLLQLAFKPELLTEDNFNQAASFARISKSLANLSGGDEEFDASAEQGFSLSFDVGTVQKAKISVLNSTLNKTLWLVALYLQNSFASLYITFTFVLTIGNPRESCYGRREREIRRVFL